MLPFGLKRCLTGLDPRARVWEPGLFLSGWAPLFSNENNTVDVCNLFGYSDAISWLSEPVRIVKPSVQLNSHP